MGSNWVWEATGDSAACRLATGRALLGAVHIGGFLQQTVRKGAISKEKKGFFRGDAFSLGEEDGRVSILHMASAPCGEGRGPRWQTTFLVLDQKIPAWLIKRMFLGESKLQLVQVRNLGLGPWAQQEFFFKKLHVMSLLLLRKECPA